MGNIRVSSTPAMILVGVVTFIPLLQGAGLTAKAGLLILAVSLFSGILSALTVLPVVGQLVYVYGMKWALDLAGFSLSWKFLLGESFIVPAFLALEYFALYFLMWLVDRK